MTSMTVPRTRVPWAKVELLLLASRYLWLATTDEGGRAGVVPLRFLWSDGALMLAAGPKSRRGLDLRTGAPIAAHVGDGDDLVLVHGRVVSTGRSEAAAPRRALERKYAGQLGSSTPHAMTCRVAVSRVTAWRHEDVATRAQWRWDSTG